MFARETFKPGNLSSLSTPRPQTISFGGKRTVVFEVSLWMGTLLPLVPLLFPSNPPIVWMGGWGVTSSGQRLQPLLLCLHFRG